MTLARRILRRQHRHALRPTRALVCLVACFVGVRAFAGSQLLAPSDDTFINSGNPANNNGGSTSIFTGTDGHGGFMRGLIRFDLPATLTGRATVASAQLTLTTLALGSGAGGTTATESLHAVTQPWIQGNGVGSGSTAFTVGQPCVGAITGATWNQANCTTATNWATAGATVAVTVSASATSPATVGTPVTWTGLGLNADVQGWIDVPGSNYGWQITSSTEGPATGLAQRFSSTEAGVSIPGLAITYSCKTGFFDNGSGCTTCTAAANASCAVTQGNTCVDGGPPSTTYTCACNNPIYVPGTGVGGNAACLPLTLDIDNNGAYDALTDGLLVIRYLFGLSDAALITGAIGPGATRASPAAITQYLGTLNLALDIDGNAQRDAATDGLILIRYLFGLRGPALIEGAIGTNATRSGAQIETYLQSLLP